MQNKKKTLLLALICLCVTLPGLSGCRFTGGPAYKMSSWQLYNPFSSKSKHKDFDDFALAQQFDEPSSLQKQDVTTPRDGYLVNSRDTNKLVSTGTNRTNSNNSNDRLSDLHNAGLERNSGAASSSSRATASQPKATDTMFAQTGSAGTSANSQPYGTTTPIEQGFGTTNLNQMALQPSQSGTPSFDPYLAPVQQPLPQQPMAQQPGYQAYQVEPNAGMFAAGNPSQTSGGTPFDQSGYGQQPGQQFATAGQPQPQNQSYYPGQPTNMPTNMMVQNAEQSQGTLYGNGDPLYGGFSNPAMAGSQASPQMVASTQGSGYTGQSMLAADPMYLNPGQAAPGQTMTPPQGTVPANTATPTAGYGQQPVTTPNGQATDPAYGFNGFNSPAAQQSQQATATQNPWGQPAATQQPTNNGYQNGFNYFGPTADDVYRPGGTW